MPENRADQIARAPVMHIGLSFRTRVAANISNWLIASRTALSCASIIRLSLPTNAAMETDFGGENVKSKNTRRLADSWSYPVFIHC